MADCLPRINRDGSVYFPASPETLAAVTAWVRTLRPPPDPRGMCPDHARTVRKLADPRHCHHIDPDSLARLAADLRRQCRACLGVPAASGLGRERHA